MDLPQPGEGALAQPTRARIFSFLVDKRAPASTEELAERLGLHPNGVRRHLEMLRSEDLVAKGQARSGPGRPRDTWAVSPGARPDGARPRAYGDLARWLARSMEPGPDGHREVESVGREIGRELAPGTGADPVDAFRDTLAALGFQPALDRGEGGYVCRLGNCPYRDSARESAEVVCSLHRGITAGILAELDPEAELARFEPHDPELAGCMVEVVAPSASG